MNVLILQYTHPEGYPPTLNAINYIAKQADKVTILSTETLATKWKYSPNVNLILLKSYYNNFSQAKHSKLNKIKTYINYTYKIYRILKSESIDLLVIYDNVPFFFYTISSFFTKKRFKVWYHNHDVYPLSSFNKYSVNWFGAVSERKIKHFNKIDYFSLPAEERKNMYPMESFKGKFFYIPNYPSKDFINHNEPIDNQQDRNQIKIVYPGSSSHKNGFKELIDIMGQKINEKIVTLTLIGDVHQNFKDDLLTYAKTKNVENQIFFKERIPYIEMTNYLKQFHIGWALYKPVDLSVATAGSSSNKIYEFLANGLPIIVFDNEHHHFHLNNCKAAFFSDLSKTSIIKEIKEIDNNLSQLTMIAKNEFETKYQFEIKFEKALKTVLKDTIHMKSKI